MSTTGKTPYSQDASAISLSMAVAAASSVSYAMTGCGTEPLAVSYTTVTR